MNRIFKQFAAVMALLASVMMGLPNPAQAQTAPEAYAQSQPITATPADPLELQFGPPTWDGVYMVTPTIGLTAWELDIYRTYGCVAPEASFGELTRRAIERGEMCDEGFWDRVDGKTEEGALQFFMQRSPIGHFLVTYAKGISQSPNVTCVGFIPRGAVVGTPIGMSCTNSESGGMTVANVIGNILGNGGAMALGSFVANVTAPSAGDFIVNNGSVSDATAGVAANQGTSVTTPPVTVNNINQNANQNNVGTFDPSCPTGSCPSGYVPPNNQY